MGKSFNLFKWLFKGKTEIDLTAVIDESWESFSLKVLAVNIALSYVSETISKCNFKFYENNELQKYKEVDFLFNVSANPNMTSVDLKKNLILKLYSDKEALIFSHNGHLYLADSFVRKRKPFSEDIFSDISVNNEKLSKSFFSSEVYYFELTDPDIVSLIDSMYYDFRNIIDYSIKNYKNSNSEKYKLILDNIKVGDEEFNKNYEDTIKAQLKSFIENPRAIYPEFKGYKLEKFVEKSDKTDSGDVINLKKDMFETVAIAFKMPVSFLYGNMTNVKDLTNSFITFTIDPIARNVEAEITRKTYKLYGYSKKNYCKVDTTAIQHIDIFEAAKNINQLISSGAYNIDEVREKAGDNTLDTDFSKQHWMTKNYDTIEHVLDDIEDYMKGGG